MKNKAGIIFFVIPALFLSKKGFMMNYLKVAKNSAVFISKMVNKKGKMLYEWDIKTGIKEKKYNMLRHSGCILAMSELYPEIKSSSLKKKINKAIFFQSKKTFGIKTNGVPIYIIDGHYHKLGANAIAILALLKTYNNVSNNRDYLNLAIRYGEHLLNSIDGIGTIVDHKIDLRTGKKVDFVSSFYPGEIIYAFVELYKATKNQIWLQTALLIIYNLRKTRDKEKQIRDHWQLQAFEKIYPFLEKKEKSFIKKYAKRIVKTEPIPIESLKTIPSGPIGARTEALIAYYNLTKNRNYLKIANRQLKQLKKFQITEGKYKGGFLYKLNSTKTRIDHSQHSGLAFYQYYKAKRDKS